MPTGYTDAIKDGITFQQYAMSCARAFGALITMRDDPSDAVIPNEFKPNTEYHDLAIERAKSLLLKLDGMSAHECELAALGEREKRLADAKRDRAEREALREKYSAMMGKAIDWLPPSEDHKELQRFMIDQIEESIKWDCGGSYYEELAAKSPADGAAWRAEQQRCAARDLAYHVEQRQQEVERTDKRNEWVRLLRESLTN